MLQLIRKRLLMAGVIAAMLGAAAAIAAAENIDPVNDNSQFAWGENVGWINAEPSGPGGPGIQVSGTGLTGYMYGENIGWINLNCTNNATCGATGNYGVTNDGQGNLGGYAWAENVGWISFCDQDVPGTCNTGGSSTYRVVIDKATGIFSGFAYGENIGWISFSDTTPVAYKVQTDDGDGIAGATDNCPFDANVGQEHNDRNFIDQTPPSSQDDRTWPMSDSTGDACDTDDDNDGILDVNEAAGCNGSGPLLPTNRDTDGDRMLDGAECTLLTNPASAASKPSVAQCAAAVGVASNVDTDGDKIRDHIEFCAYNTNRLLIDSDGDQDAFPLNPTPSVNLVRDGCEAASLNNDRTVSSGDQLLLVLEIVREIDQTLRLVSMDINKDGGVNSGDQLLMVTFISAVGACP